MLWKDGRESRSEDETHEGCEGYVHAVPAVQAEDAADDAAVPAAAAAVPAEEAVFLIITCNKHVKHYQWDINTLPSDLCCFTSP